MESRPLSREDAKLSIEKAGEFGTHVVQVATARTLTFVKVAGNELQLRATTSEPAGQAVRIRDHFEPWRRLWFNTRRCNRCTFGFYCAYHFHGEFSASAEVPVKKPSADVFRC